MQIKLVNARNYQPKNATDAETYVVDIELDQSFTEEMFFKLLEAGKHIPNLSCDEDDDL